MGRHTILTPEAQDRFLQAIEKGHKKRDAAHLAGISKSSLYRWLQKGEAAKSGRFWEFWDKYQGAISRNVDILMTTAMEAATVGYTKKKVQRKTVRDSDGKSMRGPDGKLLVEIVETEDQVPPNGALALEIMARKRPDDWGRHVAVDHSGQVDTNVVGPIEVIWKQAPKRDAGGDVVEDDTVHL